MTRLRTRLFDSASEPRSVAHRGNRDTSDRALMVVLTAMAALTAMSMDLYLPAIPAIAADLEVATTAVSGGTTAFVVSFGVGQLGFGPLADRFGRRRPLIVALLAYLIGTAVCFFAAGIDGFFVGRIVQGLGASAGAVSFVTIARDRWSGVELTRVFAWMTAGAALAPMVAPLLGNAIASAWGWRWVFALLAIHAVTVLVGVVEVLDSPGVDVRGEARRGRWLHELRRPAFIAPALVHAFAFTGLFAYLLAGTEVLMVQRGLSPTHFGLYFAANALVYMVANAATSRWSGRIGAEGILVCGAIAMGVGGVSMLSIQNLSTGWALMFPMFVVTAGVGALMPQSATMAMNALDAAVARGAAVLGFVRFSVAGLCGLWVQAHAAAWTIATVSLIVALFVFALAEAPRRWPGRRVAAG